MSPTIFHLELNEVDTLLLQNWVLKDFMDTISDCVSIAVFEHGHKYYHASHNQVLDGIFHQGLVDVNLFNNSSEKSK